jgi:hypothetical protein
MSIGTASLGMPEASSAVSPWLFAPASKFATIEPGRGGYCSWSLGENGETNVSAIPREFRRRRRTSVPADEFSLGMAG